MAGGWEVRLLFLWAGGTTGFWDSEVARGSTGRRRHAISPEWVDVTRQMGLRIL